MNLTGEMRSCGGLYFEFDISDRWSKSEHTGLVRINGAPVSLIRQVGPVCPLTRRVPVLCKLIPEEPIIVCLSNDYYIGYVHKKTRGLEERVEELEKCNHEYEIVGGRNSNYRIYYNMCNAYIQCVKCGKHESI